MGESGVGIYPTSARRPAEKTSVIELIRNTLLFFLRDGHETLVG